MILLRTASSSCSLSPTDGGRVASLIAGDKELLIQGSTTDSPLSWGSYPMAPWAGRVNAGRFSFAGITYSLPIVMGGHAIHGTVYLRPWTVESHDATSVALSCELGDDWPLGGHAQQVVTLEETRLQCVLSVTAHNSPMPCTLGWHPWFVKPVSDSLHFEQMAQRLPNGIPSGLLVAPSPRPWDDCFSHPIGALMLHYSQLSVTIESDCDYWTIYDEPEHATCVEPQSGPPDQFNLEPFVLEAGQTLRRVMVVSWSFPGRDEQQRPCDSSVTSTPLVTDR